ncbi:uncharacterized protein LOC135205258 [Macrobrachium nipponense]|uniref:uncharacterized protein LOC135205258 n=1 Tax=Macrobrachium nipponense TaxID=159736 RepID=UPI0030C824E7
MLPTVLTTFCVMIAARLRSASAGSLPGDFKWSIALKEIKLGEQTAITYQVDNKVPDFHLTFHVDSTVIEEMQVTETPVFGMTVHKMEKTGRHNVSVHLTWGGDQTANFFDYVWVYRPIANAHVLFAVTSSVVVPPGNISALITITDSTELPTMVVGFISWGDEQMTTLNLTQGTLPGSSGAASWTEEHTYAESQNFTVTLTLRNPVSLVKLNRTVITTEKLSLYNVTIKDHAGSLAPSTLTSGKPVVFELFAESGIARMYILKVGEEVVRSLQRQIPYEFRKPGRYEVTAEISGPAGVSEPYMIEVDVEAALQSREIKLEMPSMVVFPPGNATAYVEITSDAQLPTNVQGSISWGDKGPSTYIDLRNDTGPEATGSLRRPLVHTFAGAGLYEVVLYAYNNVSSVNITKMVSGVGAIVSSKADVTITLTSTGELPTRVSGYIAWGDDVQEGEVRRDSEFDLSDVTAPGNTGSVSTVLEYSFGRSGVYNMTACLKNNVSVVFASREIRVIDHITLRAVTVEYSDEADIPDWQTEVFKTSVNLNITAIVDTGAVEQFVLSADGDLLTNPGPSFTYAFDKVRVVDDLALSRIVVSYQDPADEPGWNTTWLKTGVDLRFQAILDTGEATSYALYVEGEAQPITSPNSTILYRFALAGEYHINMSCSGEAGVSPVVVSTVKVAHPISPNHPTLRVPTLVVWPPGGAKVTVTLSSDTQLPTYVQGSVDWGDAGVPETPLDFTNGTAPSAAGSVSLDLFHNYTEPGEVTVTLRLRNPVSLFNMSDKLNVLASLALGGIDVQYENPSDSPRWDTPVFKAHIPLNLTAMVQTGQVEEYILQIGNKTMTSRKPSFVYTFLSAGDYTVTMRASGSAGDSNVQSALVRIAQPLTADNAIIEPPEYVVFPPGRLNVTLTLTAFMREVATNVTGWMTWGDSPEMVETDLAEDTGPGVPGPVALVLEHQYSSTGQFAITWFLRNPVSEMNVTEIESDYEVTMTAEGSSGISEPVSAFVRVRRKVSGLKVEVSHTATRVMLEVTFQIEDPLLLGGCVSLDLGERDGRLLGWRQASGCEGQEAGTEEWSQAPPTGRITLAHRYSSPGVYAPKARLFSFMGEETLAFQITVYESLPCSELRVWIPRNGTLDSPVNMTRADKLRIRSSSSVNCSASDLSMEIGWKIIRINDSLEVDLGETDTGKGVLFLQRRTLHYGLYRAVVSYNISMTNPSSGIPVWEYLESESVVNVSKSDLMVVIVGGGAPKIRRGNLQTLLLRPMQYSYDPDYPETPLASYVWSCRLVGETLPDRGVTSDPPLTREPYENSIDHGGCWGEGPAWLTNEKGSLSIDVDLFRSLYKVYKMAVIASSKDGRSASSSVEIEVVEGNPPPLVSYCNPPWFCVQVKGAQLVNPTKLILESDEEMEEGKEVAGETVAPLNFTWSVFGVINSESSEPISIEGVAVGMNNRKLALLDAFWETYGSTYKLFDVEVTANRVGEDAKGLAVQRIQINEAPTGGSCVALLPEEVGEEGASALLQSETRDNAEVPTLEVISLVESVLCNCTGWVDPEGFEIPKYSFYGVSSAGEKMVFSFGTEPKGTIVLPYTNMTLWAGVADILGAEASYLMAHIVPILPTKETFEEYMGRNELVKAAGARDQTRVDMLLKAENSLKGIGLQSEADVDGEGAMEDGEDDDKAKEKNEKMLGSLDSFTTTSMEEVIQVNSILNSVADPLPKEKQEGAVDTLVKLSRAKDREAPLSLQKDFMAGALSTTANLLNGVNKEVNSSKAMNSTNMAQETVKRLRRSVARASNFSIDYDDAEEEDQPVEPYEPTEDEINANEKVGKMLDVVGNSQSALLEAAVSGEEPTKIEAGDKVNVAVAFFDASELRDKQVEIGGATYVFPSYCAILREDEDCLVNKSISIGVKMTKWKGQVHGYGGGRDQLSDDSSTLQLSLVDINLNPIPVRDTLEDFVMYIPRAEETISEPELIDPNVSGLGLSVHNIYVPAPRVGVTVLVRPENDSDIEDWIITWSSSKLNGTPEYMENVMYVTALPYHNDTGFYELFLDSDVIGNETGMYSVGFGRYNYTVPEILEHPCFEDPPNNTLLVSFDTQFDTNYSLSTFVSSCLFFDNELLTWSSDGCKVIGANATVTICSCNHLTSFGSGFFVTPNTIDFAYVFANAGFADNLTIYLVLIISLALYFIGLVYARIMDKKDVEKVGATPLPDNDPEDRYLYDVMVHTGHFPGSGTKSKVQFLLVGDWNETDVRTLNEDTKRPLLTRGASDHFVLANDRPLGPLQYLRIWHDNSGKGKTASWYFSYMVVRDVQSGEEFQFICNSWLAVEEGDGLIDRLIPVAGDEQKRDRAHVFGKTVEKNLSDDHLWFSVFLRPARSRFTRVQRLSACMALLYLSMLVNAMFYERVPDTPGAGGLNLGFFSVSPEAMGVGFISNLIVFPPSFLIVFFFRKARPRSPKKSRLREALVKQTLHSGEEVDDANAKPPKKGFFHFLSAIRSACSISKPKDPEGQRKSPTDIKPTTLEAKQKHPWSTKLVPSEPQEDNSSGSRVGKRSSATSQSSRQQLITPENSSSSREENGQEKSLSRRKRKLTLPWWCVIIAWVLCAISIMVAVFFLWAYGIQFGNEKATKWLTALISSIFSSVLFTQPIKIYLTAMLLSYICKKPLNEHEDYDDDEEEFDAESDETLLHGPPTGHSYRRRRSQIQLGPGMSAEELEAARSRREKEVAMQALIFEIGVYSIFLTIILSVGYGSRDPNIFFMRQNVVNTFVESQVGGDSECPPFSEAAVESDLWCWAREILIPNLMDPYLYNGEHRPQTMCGTLIDRVSFLLGHPIFRQIRKVPGPSHQRPVNRPRSEDNRDFGLGWNVTGKGPPHYIYRSSLQLHGFPYDGILDKYSGGGYLLELRGPHYKAHQTLNRLENEGWIDEQTKAIFVEFAFYNPQVNLFGVVMFIFEFFEGGGFLAKFKFQGLSLLRYHRPGGFYILLSEIAYLIFTFFYTRREYKSLKKLKRAYFNSVWNILEIAILILSYTAIVFYLLKTSLTYYTIDKFTATKGKKYIRMQPLAFLDEVVGYVISFQVFIGTLKLLKLLRFNKRIGMLSATLKHAAGDILGFGLLFVVMLFSFSSVFYLISMTSVEEFSTFSRAVESCFFEINKKFVDVRESSRILGPIFYFVFAFLLYWLVFQLLIAIICNAFAEVSSDLSAQPNDYEVVEYIMSRVSAYISAFHPNSVREVNIQAPRGPDIDSQLRHLNHSLDKALDALDRVTGGQQQTPSAEKEKQGRE